MKNQSAATQVTVMLSAEAIAVCRVLQRAQPGLTLDEIVSACAERAGRQWSIFRALSEAGALK
jgi:hypothetical protein